MTNGNIDRLPVNQLPQRYNLARSAVYTRMNALGIEPERVGNRSFVNGEQVQLMDELHAFIQQGRSTAEFLVMRGIAPNDKASPDLPPSSSSGLTRGQSSGLTDGQNDFINLLGQLIPRLQPKAPEPHPLEYFRYLEEAYRNRWLFSTSELAYLLNIPAADLERYTDQFYEAGFVFIRAGYRADGEVAWQISKPQSF